MRVSDADRPIPESAAFGGSTRSADWIRACAVVPLSPALRSGEQSNQATQYAFHLGTPAAIAANSTSRSGTSVVTEAPD